MKPPCWPVRKLLLSPAYVSCSGIFVLTEYEIYPAVTFKACLGLGSWCTVRAVGGGVRLYRLALGQKVLINWNTIGTSSFVGRKQLSYENAQVQVI